MFERFSGGTRRVLVLAQREADLLGAEVIGTEHLLLGMTADRESTPARVLGALGVDADRIRTRLGGPVEPVATPPAKARPLSSHARAVLDASGRLATDLGHDEIGPEHLLLALLDGGEGRAIEMLEGMGVDLDTVRRRVAPAAGRWSASPGLWGRRVDGPRCAGCGERLDLRFRDMAAAGDEEQTVSEVRVTVVYCRHCGVPLATFRDDRPVDP